MRGQYHAKRGGDPRRVHRFDHDEAASARLFLCAGCRAQALICSCCDRGQIYCAGECGPLARRRGQRAAGARYQTSRRGRRAHAERARRYRARREKVTHHGSPAPAPDDCLPPGSRMIASGVTNLDERLPAAGLALPLVWAALCGSRPPGFFAPPRPPSDQRHDRTGRGHGDTT